MAGLFLTVPTTFTDTASPIYLNDPMESAGTLMLVDPTHPYLGWGSATLPANGGVVPNVFRDKVAAKLGAATTAVDATFINDGYLSGSLGKVERSGKGGVHVIMSTTATAASKGVQIRMPQAVLDYMKANPTHSYYLSNWAIDTKAPTGGVVMPAAMHSSAIPHAIQVAAALGSGASEPADSYARNLGNYGSSVTAGAPTGAQFRNAAVSNVTGWANQYTTYGATMQTNSSVFVHGTWGANSGGSSLGKLGSRVFLRTYLEDLTAAGRTYADAHKLDLAAFNKEVLTAGGRYYADTFTDPNTIP